MQPRVFTALLRRLPALRCFRNTVAFKAPQSILAFLLTWPVVSGTGCAKLRTTEPKQTATEQLLMSTATDRALQSVNVGFVRDRKVYLDFQFLESYQKEYLAASIRDLLSSNGGRLVDKLEDAEILVEARSGAHSIDSSSSLVGVPSLPFVIPFIGSMETPELALFKKERQDSVAKFALLMYESGSRKHVFSSGSMVGKAKFHHYRLLGFFQFRITDIPEYRIFRAQSGDSNQQP